MARIELKHGAELLTFPISTDKFVIYKKKNGRYYLRAKIHVDYSNLDEFIDSLNQVIHERMMELKAASGEVC